jgi:hypothetical protein
MGEEALTSASPEPDPRTACAAGIRPMDLVRPKSIQRMPIDAKARRTGSPDSRRPRATCRYPSGRSRRSLVTPVGLQVLSAERRPPATVENFVTSAAFRGPMGMTARDQARKPLPEM